MCIDNDTIGPEALRHQCVTPPQAIIVVQAAISSQLALVGNIL
jgi:hypothetical protein